MDQHCTHCRNWLTFQPRSTRWCGQCRNVSCIRGTQSTPNPVIIVQGGGVGIITQQSISLYAVIDVIITRGVNTTLNICAAGLRTRRLALVQNLPLLSSTVWCYSYIISTFHLPFTVHSALFRFFVAIYSSVIMLHFKCNHTTVILGMAAAFICNSKHHIGNGYV